MNVSLPFIEDVVIEAVKDLSYPESAPIEVTRETSLRGDLCLDSLDLVELGIELEERLDPYLPGCDLEIDWSKEGATVGDVAKLAHERILSCVGS